MYHMRTNQSQRCFRAIFALSLWFYCLSPVSVLSGGESVAGAVEHSAAHQASANSITQSELKRHVDILADDSFEGRAAGSRGGHAASGYLRGQLNQIGVESMGDDGDYFQTFHNNYRNILARIPGTDAKLKDEYILIGAHYDHVGYGTGRTSFGPTGYIHNGADDNASGTASLLELAEALHLSDWRRSILIAFWDGEELGLLGSKHFIRNPVVPLKNIRAMINMDMVGRLREQKLTMFGSRTLIGSRRLVSEQNEGLPLLIDFSWEIKPNSDHHPFFSHGIPYLMPHTGLHDDYHRPRDDAHKINTDGIEQTTRLLFRVISILADKDVIGEFRQASRSESPRLRQQLERPLRPAPKRLGLSWNSSDNTDIGLEVRRVGYRSAAAAAGIRIGDRITEFDGVTVESDAAMRTAVFRAKRMTTATITRPGEEEPLTIPLKLAGEPMRLGLSWRLDDAEPNAAIVTRVVPGSPADAAGLKIMDRIYSVENENVADREQLVASFKASEFPVTLKIEREGNQQTITLGMEEGLQKAALLDPIP